MCKGEIGVPSPSSVENAEVTIIKWRYLDAYETIEYTEIWKDGVKLATNSRSIGIGGAIGNS
jgi:hypothetical protein